MSDEGGGEKNMVLHMKTVRPSGSCGRMELEVSTTTEGSLHRFTAQRIINFLLSEIRKMDAESAGIEHRPEVEAEFGKPYKSSWPRKE